MKRAFYTCTGLHPSGEGIINYTVCKKLVEEIEKSGRSAQYFALNSAGDVLSHPTCICQGLNRKGHENALAYAGRPMQYGYDGAVQPPAECVFVVYVSEGGVIFEWGWEKADRRDGGLPENCSTRFNKIIWKA